jgi:hypothetical protein
MPTWVIWAGQFVVVILGAAGITVLYHVLIRQRDPVRDKRMSDLAGRLGLRYSAKDSLDLGRLPFELVRSGGPALIQNVVWGEYRQMPITAFEYRRLSREQVGGKERPWAFSCVMTALPISASEVVIERQSADAYQLGRSISRAPLIQTESVEFDRAFAVHARDLRFALSLLDPGVMGWLLTSPGNWNFEFYGGRVLCYSPVQEIAQVEDLMKTMHDLRDRIPSVVRDFALASATHTESLRSAGERQPPRPLRVSSILIVAGVLLFFVVVLAITYYLYWAAAKGAL